MRRLSLLVLLCLSMMPSIASPWAASAREDTRTPEVREVDRRIHDARARIDMWNRRLGRWQEQIGDAAVTVDRLTRWVSGSSPETGSVDVRRRIAPPWEALPYRLNLAHRSLQNILTDPEATNAQQQIQALTSYIGRLQHARDLLLEAHEDAPQRRGVVPREPLTYEGWARAFLSWIGASTCGENLTVVITWETAESTSAFFNPLATTHAMDGATEINSVGVKNYVSLRQGLDASRDTLEGGAESYGYDAILSSLRACEHAKVTAAAINASAWCRGCTGGAYITGLLPIVRAGYADHAARLISVP